MLFLPPFIIVLLVIVILCDIFVAIGFAGRLAFGIAAMVHFNVWSCLLLQLLQTGFYGFHCSLNLNIGRCSRFELCFVFLVV